MKLIILILFTFISLQLFPQGSTNSYFFYSYDNAGNRISRELITLTPRPLDSIPDSIIRQYGISGMVAAQKQEQSNTASKGLNTQATSGGLAAIRIFPNPAKTELNIDGTQAGIETLQGLSLHGMDGKLVHKEENFSIPGQLSMVGLPEGSYVLRIRSGNDTREWVVLKIK